MSEKLKVTVLRPRNRCKLPPG